MLIFTCIRDEFQVSGFSADQCERTAGEDERDEVVDEPTAEDVRWGGLGNRTQHFRDAFITETGLNVRLENHIYIVCWHSSFKNVGFGKCLVTRCLLQITSATSISFSRSFVTNSFHISTLKKSLQDLPLKYRIEILVAAICTTIIAQCT